MFQNKKLIFKRFKHVFEPGVLDSRQTDITIYSVAIAVKKVKY